MRGEGGQVGASSLERWRRKAEGCRHPSSQSSVAAIKAYSSCSLPWFAPLKGLSKSEYLLWIWAGLHWPFFLSHHYNQWLWFINFSLSVSHTRGLRCLFILLLSFCPFRLRNRSMKRLDYGFNLMFIWWIRTNIFKKIISIVFFFSNFLSHQI